MPSVRAALASAALSYTAVPFWVLVTGHVLSVLPLYEGYTPYWLTHWFVLFLAAFGGGTTSALLLQNPAVAPVGIFSRNEIGLCFMLAWWAYQYAPGSALVRRAAAWPPVRAACKVARSILRANTVVRRTDAAARLYPGVVAAPLLLGTLGGCGGRLLVDAFSHCAGYKSGPNELSHPGYAIRSAATGAALQWLLVHASGLLSAQEGLGLVVSLYVAHSLATDLSGRPCDYTAPLGALFHTVTRIPVPDTAVAPAAATPAARPGLVARPRRRRVSALATPAVSDGEQLGDVAPARTATRRTVRAGAAARVA